MAEALIYEFNGVNQEHYDAVNSKLGIDMIGGTGPFPEGLLAHAAGTADDGSFIVNEVWSSRAANESFVQSRLGEALASVGVPAPVKVTWVSLIAFQTPNA